MVKYKIKHALPHIFPFIIYAILYKHSVPLHYYGVTMSIRPYQGKTPIIGSEVFIDESAIIIGDVELGEQCSVWPYAVIRGDVNSIRIGARSNVQDGCVLHVTHKNEESSRAGSPLTIGDDVTIGHKAVLHGCTIGNRVLIGMGSIILDDVEISNDVIIGAGTVVPPGKKLNGGYLYVGNPAKQLRPLIESEKEFLLYSAQQYVKLKNTY